MVKNPILQFHLVALVFLACDARTVRSNNFGTQPTSTQYILSTSILALSEQFFTNMQKIFIPHVFNYISKNQQNLNFPESAFFLYRLQRDDDQSAIDWEKSVYLNMSVSQFNITDWGYESGAAETGIMLVESIQNFKTYFSQIRFFSNFSINVDFTRLYCSDISCEPIQQTYTANLTLARMNMSISQKFDVYDNSNGTLNTSIQSISLSLGPNDLNLGFHQHQPDFSNTINRTFASIKDYFLQNTNQLAQDQKRGIEGLLQVVLDMFSVIKIPFLNNTLILRPMDSSRNQGTNPIINSNYISTLMSIEVETPDNVTSAFDNVYLPIKEQGSGSQSDLAYNQVQFIASQTLLVKILSSIWKSEVFLKDHNPSLVLPFISFNETTGTPIPCDMDVLMRQFPNIKQTFTNNSCEVALKIADVQDFTINTGRFYTINKTQTLNMDIHILDDQQKILFIIALLVPLDNLYISFSLLNSRMSYQIYNFQPYNFTLLTHTKETDGFDSDRMLAYWNSMFKMQFLKYLNQPDRQSFNLPEQAYSWINSNVTRSVASFKFDLYDKFAIINIQPRYDANELIWLIGQYIQNNLPPSPSGEPYTFTTFIEELYGYIVNQISHNTERLQEIVNESVKKHQQLQAKKKLRNKRN